jgi:hypothetical protein
VIQIENWVIFSSMGIIESAGSFKTEKECEAKCEELRNINSLANIFYLPINTNEEPNK